MSPPPGTGGAALPAPVDVTPDEINSAAKTFAQQQYSVLCPMIEYLSNTLSDCAGMAGNDSAAHTFANKYDPAAKAAMAALDTAVAALGSMADGLLQTANNYILADHHSTEGAAGAPQTYPPLMDLVAETDPPPPSAVGAGSSGLPGPLSKFWPNGHQDLLRKAGGAWHTAAVVLEEMAGTLQRTVTSLTDYNSSASMTAMTAFWAQIWGPNGTQGCLNVLNTACGQLSAACDQYATAIDNAHSKIEHALVGTGIAVGLTSAVGFVVGLFSGGGGDAAAAWADSAEAGAILGPILAEFDTEVSTEVVAAIEDELVPMLEAAADSTPELDTVEADTTQVSRVLDQEMEDAKVPARVGGGGGSEPPPGGGGPPTGGDPPGDDPGDPGDDDPTDPRDVHGQSRTGERGIDVDYVNQNGDLYIQNDDGQLVRVLDNGDGTSDVVIRDPSNPSGKPTTVMRVPNRYVQNKVENGDWD